jgi:hypothetical protein
MGGPSAAGAAGAGVASRSLPADAFSAAVAESAQAESKDGEDGKPGSARKRATPASLRASPISCFVGLTLLLVVGLYARCTVGGVTMTQKALDMAQVRMLLGYSHASCDPLLPVFFSVCFALNPACVRLVCWTLLREWRGLRVCHS